MSTNPYIQDGGIEYYSEYRPGGYHPVHIGDTFKDGQYTILHKLGYGSYSTVWLVRDEIKNLYASLKVLTADALKSSSGTELDVLRRAATGEGAGKRFVLQYLDDFTHQGPNGTHLCIVTEVSGPDLSSYLGGVVDDGELPPEIARTFVSQFARGVEYLHSCGIVHGDLHLGNILYHSPAINLHSSRDVEKFFGKPETSVIRFHKGATAPYGPPHVPRYVVHPPDSFLFLQPFFSDPAAVQIRICDFSEASLHDPAHPEGIRRKMNCPNVHAAPEIIFDDLASPASDIWAMGNTMHQILTGGPEGRTFIPGRGGCSRDEVVAEMVRLLGKLPTKWWSRWEARSKYYEESGHPVGEADTIPLAPLASRITEFYLPGELHRVFERVLEGIFRYETRDRLRADEIVRALQSLEVVQTITTLPTPAA